MILRQYDYLLILLPPQGQGDDPAEGGGVLWGKKYRGDFQKSKKTTLKNSKPQNLRTLKYTFLSKINLKNTNKPEFIKEAYSKDVFLYPNKYLFYFF